MKKISVLFTILLVLGLSSSSFAQLAKNSWSVGFGLSYPRFMNAPLGAGEGYYGAGYVSLQRNFSEHVGLRLKGSFLTLKDKNADNTNSSLIGNLDLVYYLVPCEVLSPYFTFGGGFGYSMYDGNVKVLYDSDIDYEVAFSFGADYAINNNWKVKAEFGFHTMSNSYFNGITSKGAGSGVGGLFGAAGSSYMVAEVGAIYYFKKGEPSKLCQMYDGISVEAPKSAEVDYDKIENLIKKHIPKEVVKEVVVEKPVPVPQVQQPKVPTPQPEVKKPTVFEGKKNWVLKGVKFATNSAKLDKGSFALLDEAVQVLKDNPNLKIEVQGYTDNVGKVEANQTLSQARAASVKDYFTSKGIAASRLTAIGYGSANPVADNTTPAGRAENRRIELKVVD